MLSKQRNAQLRLALILQRWYRGGSVNETMRKLKRDALERVASKTLQRVFRGYLGRRRLNLKREFVYLLVAGTDAAQRGGFERRITFKILAAKLIHHQCLQARQ